MLEQLRSSKTSWVDWKTNDQSQRTFTKELFAVVRLGHLIPNIVGEFAAIFHPFSY